MQNTEQKINELNTTISNDSKIIRRNSTVGSICFGAGTIVLASALGAIKEKEYTLATIESIIGVFNLYMSKENIKMAYSKLQEIKKLHSEMNELKRQKSK